MTPWQPHGGGGCFSAGQSCPLIDYDTGPAFRLTVSNTAPANRNVPSQDQRYVDPLDPKAELPDNEDAIYTIPADLTREGDLERIVELVLGRFEGVDLLVNAAVHSVWAPMVDSNRLLASCERQFHTNVIVPLKLSVLLARRFWRDHDRENRKRNRNVIHVSSAGGLQTYPNLGQSVYSASKAALNYLTCHMAEEFGRFGVRVNATAPDSFPSAIPTEKAAESIVRLDEGDMTGRVLVVDRNGERFA